MRESSLTRLAPAPSGGLSDDHITLVTPHEESQLNAERAF